MHSTMSVAKSQMFFSLAQNIFRKKEKTVDKEAELCLNVTNMAKTLTENLSSHKPFAESRWLGQTGKGAEDDLIPESVV